MAILAFQKPDKVIMIEADEFRGVFEFQSAGTGFRRYHRKYPEKNPAIIP